MKIGTQAPTASRWTRDDLPRPDAIRFVTDDVALDLVVDHLNAHHPKPQPYDQGGVRGVDSLLYRAERERDAAVRTCDELRYQIRDQAYTIGTLRGDRNEALRLRKRAERERDAAVARAEQAEQLIPAYAMLDIWVALGRDSIHFDDWYDHNGYADAWAELTSAVREARTAPAVSRADVERVVHRYIDGGFDELHVSRVKSATDAFMALLSGDDPAVFVVRESHVRAEDGSFEVTDRGTRIDLTIHGRAMHPVSSAREVRDKAQRHVEAAARCEAIARAIEAEQAVDPVEELAEQIETATRAAIRQACDDLAGVVPALDPLAVEQAMEVRAASRKVAAHVLGQEESSDE